MSKLPFRQLAALAAAQLCFSPFAAASEAQIQLPDLRAVSFRVPGGPLSGLTVLYAGLVVCVLGMLFGLWQYWQTRSLPAHVAMTDVSDTIWETCKTYLQQQGRFLIGLWGLIAICITYYFAGLSHEPLCQRRHHPALLDLRNPRQLWRGLVWHSHQHRGQLAHRLFRPAGQPARHPQHSAPLGHECRACCWFRSSCSS